MDGPIGTTTNWGHDVVKPIKFFLKHELTNVSVEEKNICPYKPTKVG